MSWRHPAILCFLAVAAVVAVAAIAHRYWPGRTADAVAPDSPSANGAAGTTGADSDAGVPVPRLPGFVDQADVSGLDFKMEYLPSEQGEAFKVNLYDHGCGLAIADYDGDGDDDVYFTNQLGPNALYRNRGDGTFEDATAEAGSIGLEGLVCVSAAFNDYDNDGDQDLYVTSTRGGNVLLRNDGGQFVDVTERAGVAWVGHSQTATFFDYDNDGHLDLFLTNSASWTLDEFNEEQRSWNGLETLADLRNSPKEYNAMFRNRGDGTFENVTDRVGLRGLGWGGDVAAFDYDEDGRIDLLVNSMFGFSQLYRNGEDGLFHDVTAETLKRTSYGAIGAKTFDYDNDGRLDLFVADMHSDMWMNYSFPLNLVEEWRKYDSVMGPFPEKNAADIELAAEVAMAFGDRVVFGNTLYRNLGGGRFEEVSDQAEAETFWPWGVATGDFDNDGHEDVFLPSGMGFPFRYWPNQLLMNDGDGTFSDRAEERGLEPPLGGFYLEELIGEERPARSSRCAAVADFDADGRLEIVVNNFNGRPYYFRNEFPVQNYIAFRLRGTTSNRDAIGAVVKCQVGDEVWVRQVQAAGGYLSQSAKAVHFGLGNRDRVDRVEIRWPSGKVQTLESPNVNQLQEIVEP